MTKNVGGIDRLLRAVIGLTLIGLAATGTVGWWGWAWCHSSPQPCAGARLIHCSAGTPTARKPGLEKSLPTTLKRQPESCLF